MYRRLISILLLTSLIVFTSLGSGILQAADSQRNFVVFFEFLNNSSGADDALKYIFNDMLEPDDQLIIFSPVRLYSFSKTTLARPKADLIAMMSEKLRGDISQAGQNYEQVIKELESIVRDIETYISMYGESENEESASHGSGSATAGITTLRDLFTRYRQGLVSLQQLRKTNDSTLRQIAGMFRNQRGQNHIILLFEREFRPIPNRVTMDQLHNMPLFAMQGNELFASDNLNAPIDTDVFGELFKQVPLTLHFLYIQSKNNFKTDAIFENSGDVYAAFSKVAKTTGGISETIAEPVAGLKSIMTALKEVK
jgi:hypothetical protein